MAPSFGGKSVATKRGINILGVGLVGIRLRAAIKGFMEGVITHASNCTAQACLLLLLSCKAAAGVELSRTNKTGVSSFPSRFLEDS